MTKRSTLVDWQGLLAFGGKTFLLLLARRSLSSALCKYTVTTIFLWNQPLPAVEHQHDDCVHSSWEHSLCYASPWRLQGSLAPCPSQEKLKQHQCKSVRFSSTMYVRQYCPSVKVRGNPASVFQTVFALKHLHFCSRSPGHTPGTCALYCHKPGELLLIQATYLLCYTSILPQSVSLIIPSR